jgi:hypothetical protein
MTVEETKNERLKEIAISKFVSLGFTEEELRALGLKSDDNS